MNRPGRRKDTLSVQLYDRTESAIRIEVGFESEDLQDSCQILIADHVGCLRLIQIHQRGHFDVFYTYYDASIFELFVPSQHRSAPVPTEFQQLTTNAPSGS